VIEGDPVAVVAVVHPAIVKYGIRGLDPVRGLVHVHDKDEEDVEEEEEEAEPPEPDVKNEGVDRRLAIVKIGIRGLVLLVPDNEDAETDVKIQGAEVVVEKRPSQRADCD